MATQKVTLQDTLKNKGEGEVITKAELDQLKADAAKVADLEKAAQEAKDAAAKAAQEAEDKIADLTKSAEEANAVLADIEKAKVAKELEDTTDVVKGFNLFDETNVEDVAKFFVANKGGVSDLILTTLEKARAAIAEFGEKEHGTDLEGVEVDTDDKLASAVGDILKARKASK